MDGATLQAKVYAGYGLAAQRIGLAYDHYRPTAAITPTPLDLGNKLGSLPAHFRIDDDLREFQKYGMALWRGWFDAAETQPGDLLEGPQGVFFIAAQQALLPPLVVGCNRIVSVSRAAAATSFGAQAGYGGDTLATEVALMTGWPASILQTINGEKSGFKLPGDLRSPWWAILLPAWPGLTLGASDIVTCDLGRRHIVASAELTELGWRLATQQAVV